MPGIQGKRHANRTGPPGEYRGPGQVKPGPGPPYKREIGGTGQAQAATGARLPGKLDSARPLVSRSGPGTVARHTELRINGPIRPGNVYCVVTRDSQHPDVVRRSLPASLAVCSDLARDTNRKAGQALAHVEYIHLTPTETTTETTERAIK